MLSDTTDLDIFEPIKGIEVTHRVHGCLRSHPLGARMLVAVDAHHRTLRVVVIHDWSTKMELFSSARRCGVRSGGVVHDRHAGPGCTEGGSGHELRSGRQHVRWPGSAAEHYPGPTDAPSRRSGGTATHIGVRP
jgi:hypothetical protein